MDRTTFKSLDFPAVLRQLSEFAQSKAAREELLSTEPWIDEVTIAHHTNAVQEIRDILNTRNVFPILGFDDCSDLLARLRSHTSLVEAPDWLRLKHFLMLGRDLRQMLDKMDRRMPICWALGKSLLVFRELIERLSEVFDAEGEVRSSASDKLRSCRSRIKRLERDIEKVFERILSQYRDRDVLQDQYWTERGGRRVVPVRAGARGKIDGLLHDTSASGETLFIEPFEAIEPSNRLAEERNVERQEIVRILSELAGEVRRELEGLTHNRETLLQMDLWHARAKLGHRHSLKHPQVRVGAIFSLFNAHHPLLFFADPDKSVPLTMELAQGNRALVVTGPNTGGKTTALKTVGLLVLMAQSAIPVPMDAESRLPLFHQILAEAGDDQNVEAGLSSFSAHIRRISWILENCADEALVLLDELGKATDPIQAGALGRAVLEALIERGALTLVTTHLATLKDWAHDSEAGRNASYRLDPETHRPMYRMHMDIPGISEAFTIAKAEGLPASIVDAAIKGLPDEERKLSDMLDSLYKREANLQAELKRAQHERKHLEKEKEHLQRERKVLQKAKLDAEEKLEEKYKGLLDTARREVESRIANLPSRKALSQARDGIARDQKSAEKRLASLKEREEKLLAHPLAPRPEVEKWEPQEGSWVTIHPGKESGQIIRLNTSKKRATVALGRLEIQAPLKKLRPAEAPDYAPDPDANKGMLRYTTGVTPQNILPEIKLIGQRVEEALNNLDKYLDQACLAHLTEIRVVHGYGTGALRTAVGEFLKTHPLISSCKMAAHDHGGNAVTVAKFRQ